VTRPPFVKDEEARMGVEMLPLAETVRFFV
jgi:hypothetical protein